MINRKIANALLLSALINCRYLARKFNLAGDGEEGFVHADMMLEHVNDFLKGNIFFADKNAFT